MPGKSFCIDATNHNYSPFHSTDYHPLKKFTFGITLPKEWTKKSELDNVRCICFRKQFWTWAAYDYYDPEAVSGGSAIWGTPPLKTVTFGLSVNF